MASLRSALSRRRRDEIELALAEPDPVRHRRRVVVAVTLVLDAVLLALSLRIQPGDAAFYPATFGLAVILLGGAWLARPKLRHDLGEEARPGPQVVTGLVVGAVLLVVFLVGAVVDETIAHQERLQIDAIWMQLGVEDPAAADRARAAGMDVVMDTCPKIEQRRLRLEGSHR